MDIPGSSLGSLLTPFLSDREFVLHRTTVHFFTFLSQFFSGHCGFDRPLKYLEGQSFTRNVSCGVTWSDQTWTSNKIFCVVLGLKMILRKNINELTRYSVENNLVPLLRIFEDLRCPNLVCLSDWFTFLCMRLFTTEITSVIQVICGCPYCSFWSSLS